MRTSAARLALACAAAVLGFVLTTAVANAYFGTWVRYFEYTFGHQRGVLLWEALGDDVWFEWGVHNFRFDEDFGVPDPDHWCEPIRLGKQGQRKALGFGHVTDREHVMAPRTPHQVERIRVWLRHWSNSPDNRPLGWQYKGQIYTDGSNAWQVWSKDYAFFDQQSVNPDYAHRCGMWESEVAVGELYAVVRTIVYDSGNSQYQYATNSLARHPRALTDRLYGQGCYESGCNVQ